MQHFTFFFQFLLKIILSLHLIVTIGTKKKYFMIIHGKYSREKKRFSNIFFCLIFSIIFCVKGIIIIIWLPLKHLPFKF